MFDWLKGWKTTVVALALVVVGQLQTWDWAALVTAENAGWIVTALGGLMAVLRYFTDTPIGSPEPKA